MASSLEVNERTMLDKGSAVDAQPIKGFSQRSRVSKSIFHFFVFCTPDCIALRAGTKIRTFLVLICSSGTPVNVVISNFSSTVMSCVSWLWVCASLHVEVFSDLLGFNSAAAALLTDNICRSAGDIEDAMFPEGGPIVNRSLSKLNLPMICPVFFPPTILDFFVCFSNCSLSLPFFFFSLPRPFSLPYPFPAVFQCRSLLIVVYMAQLATDPIYYMLSYNTYDW